MGSSQREGFEGDETWQWEENLMDRKEGQLGRREEDLNQTTRIAEEEQILPERPRTLRDRQERNRLWML